MYKYAFSPNIIYINNANLAKYRCFAKVVANFHRCKLCFFVQLCFWVCKSCLWIYLKDAFVIGILFVPNNYNYDIAMVL